MRTLSLLRGDQGRWEAFDPSMRGPRLSPQPFDPGKKKSYKVSQPAVTKGCLMEVKGAQLLHSLDGTKHHPVL